MKGLLDLHTGPTIEDKVIIYSMQNISLTPSLNSILIDAQILIHITDREYNIIIIINIMILTIGLIFKLRLDGSSGNMHAYIL